MLKAKQMFVLCGSVAIGQQLHATRKLSSHVAISLSIPSMLARCLLRWVSTCRLVHTHSSAPKSGMA